MMIQTHLDAFAGTVARDPDVTEHAARLADVDNQIGALDAAFGQVEQQILAHHDQEIAAAKANALGRRYRPQLLTPLADLQRESARLRQQRAGLAAAREHLVNRTPAIEALAAHRARARVRVAELLDQQRPLVDKLLAGHAEIQAAAQSGASRVDAQFLLGCLHLSKWRESDRQTDGRR